MEKKLSRDAFSGLGDYWKEGSAWRGYLMSMSLSLPTILLLCITELVRANISFSASKNNESRWKCPQMLQARQLQTGRNTLEC
ncbi:uncharacterized protein EI97DRAFT_239385 [Westerdykella ornata]|uniref:Uncharacterized protein n=1 Tax=Westerdykella ornata TaxID=318751 RepID=A0A6A6J7L8_WESOR|nr:uncharacterized protein EI97DRAFT_239385 [Westerdykella ornata]KAF2271998.1 hypothetical protein EI97DRAFT_239385 [Westerdykella ornata]